MCNTIYSLLNALIWDLQKRRKEVIYPTRLGFPILILHIASIHEGLEIVSMPFFFTAA